MGWLSDAHRVITVAAIATVAITGPASATLQGDITACQQSTAPDRAKQAVEACSRALENATLRGGLRARLATIRADARRHLGLFELALPDYTDALALDPNSEDAWLGRGIALLELTRYPEALSDFAKALDLQGSNDTALYWQGEAFLRSSNADAALYSFNQALIANPNTARYLFARGRAHNRLRDKNTALADISSAIQAGGRPIVIEIQTHLRTHGHYSGDIDGQYGPATRQAVQACLEDPLC